MKLHIVHGGTENGDMAKLIKAADRGRNVGSWILPKGAEAGDKVVIYVAGRGLFATGIVQGVPKKRRDWPNRYGAPLSGIRLIVPVISLESLRRELPDLSWTRFPRSVTTPSPPHARRLRQMVERRERFGIDGVPEEELRQATLEELRGFALLKGNRALPERERTRRERVRSLSIRFYAVKRAAGNCEWCEDTAPFRDSRGEAYLEVHHITRVKDDGPDDPLNVIAVCPNCHREAHFGRDPKALERSMRAKVDRIEERKRL